MVKSLNDFRRMNNERAFRSWGTHDNRLKVNQHDEKFEMQSITFLEIFRPKSLRVSDANGTRDNAERYHKIKSLLP